MNNPLSNEHPRQLALITLSEEGLQLAQTLNDSFKQADVYVRDGAQTNQDADVNTFENLRKTVEALFDRYDGFIFVMAAGIVTRVLGPIANDKSTDPAAVVMDEKGQYAIPLLSGHLGGANNLARFLAREHGAEPVITTATDVHNHPAIDELAKRENLLIESMDPIKTVHRAILSGEAIDVFTEQELDWPDPFRIRPLHPNQVVQVSDLPFNASAAVLVTNRIKKGTPQGPLLTLRPCNLHAGIGYRKDKSASELIEQIESTLNACYKHQLSLQRIATIDLKSDDPELEEVGKYFGVPIVFFGADELQTVSERVHSSSFVQKVTGTGNVCEAAALLSADPSGTILHEKTARNEITTALVEAPCESPESDRASST